MELKGMASWKGTEGQEKPIPRRGDSKCKDPEAGTSLEWMGSKRGVWVEWTE